MLVCFARKKNLMNLKKIFFLSFESNILPRKNKIFKKNKKTKLKIMELFFSRARVEI